MAEVRRFRQLFQRIVWVLALLNDFTVGRPHIVVIMADDLGWNDVGFRQGAASDLRTSNIDQLSREGLNLGNSYMMPVCTPSRAAFLTAIYPFRYGMQNSVLWATSKGSMPLQYNTFPHHLKQLGYDNHYVGKWHLGFCNTTMTPTGRGFDHFYGMYNGKATYTTHTSKYNGYDMNEETVTEQGVTYTVDWAANGTYSTELFTDKAIKILENHDPKTPLFLFLGYQAVHGDLEVPQSYIDKYCANVDTTMDGGKRQLKCAMVAAMDEGIGRVMSKLTSLGYSDDLITLFISDNGGPITEGSSNYPLSGSKTTLWEGGVKVVTVLHSKKYFASHYTAQRSAQWDGLMFATDWYPTLIRAAGETTPLTGTDGVDNWNNLLTGSVSAREWLVHNIDDVKNKSAIRHGDYKLHRIGQIPGIGDDDTGLDVKYLLYDVRNDVAETKNLRTKVDPSLLNNMKNKLLQYMWQIVPDAHYQSVETSKPKYHNGAWVTGWC